MKIAVVKYNAGNIQSVLFALDRIGVTAEVTGDAEKLKSADKVIFPGVGEASSAMQYLREHKLDQALKNLTQPVLGICLGMQLMCKTSEEGNTDCLGIIDTVVKKFTPSKQEKIKVPHVGWNTITKLKGNLFRGISENAFMYFVHSYYVEQNENSIATSNYMFDYCSAMQKNNFYAVQFHPEKSGEWGQRILKNFLSINS